MKNYPTLSDQQPYTNKAFEYDQVRKALSFKCFDAIDVRAINL